MRNADVFEINLIQEGGHVLCGVMYDSHHGRVHRKKVGGDLAAQLGEYVFLMETAENDTVVALHSSNLRAVPKGPSHTPKKAKRKPVKGTKPWTKIPYKFEDVEVGDVVELLGFVGREKKSYKICKKCADCWIDSEGLWGDRCFCPEEWQEAHILKPYKEPVEGKLLSSEEEEMYRIGDWFEVTWHRLHENFIVQIVQVSAGVVKLVTESGNRLNDVEMTHFYSVVDKSEITKALDNRTFTKLKEKQ